MPVKTLLLGLALIAAPDPAAAETRVVERVLAVADGRPVLLSEVRAAALVRGEEAGPALESVIDEMLMFAAAARLPQAAVTAEEEERALKALMEVVARRRTIDDQGRETSSERGLRPSERQGGSPKGAGGWTEGDHPPESVDEEALRRMARRQAVILKYVDFRFRPQVRVSEEEVRAAGKGDAEEARRALEAEDLDRRIEGWVADLRREARIRYNPISGTAPATR